MDDASVAERIRGIAARAATELELELVNVEVAGRGRERAVRVFIDKPEGVSHADCAAMSLHVGTVLDVEDFIPTSYRLEVSSPGLERGLYRREDYARFAGRMAKLKTREAIDGQRNFRGALIGIENGSVIFDDKANGRVCIPFETIAKANLEIDVEAEFRRATERKKAEQLKSE